MSDTRANPFLCPHCGELAVRDLNVLPQSMWSESVQTWDSECCDSVILRRLVTGNGQGYGPWETTLGVIAYRAYRLDTEHTRTLDDQRARVRRAAYAVGLLPSPQSLDLTVSAADAARVREWLAAH